MNSLATEDIIKSIRDLPSPSIVVTELLSSFERPDVNLSELAEKVSHDQALVAKTLRLANSSFYGLSRKVTTIQQAIIILGFDSVRALISTASLIDIFSSGRESAFSFQAFWRQAIGVALCSKHIARAAGVNQDYAFVCGLLHDVGKLVLITGFSQQYKGVMKHCDTADCHVLKAERAVLGTDHTVVGRLLAENWKFPILMQKAISTHHAPVQADLGDIPSIVHVADAIVHALDITGEPSDMVPELSEITWNSLNLSAADLRRIYRDTESEFEEACQILTV
jgi:putative nucleotidyltransferase with HDIG domain